MAEILVPSLWRLLKTTTRATKQKFPVQPGAYRACHHYISARALTGFTDVSPFGEAPGRRADPDDGIFPTAAPANRPANSGSRGGGVGDLGRG